jgi:hypothetical protein
MCSVGRSVGAQTRRFSASRARPIFCVGVHGFRFSRACAANHVPAPAAQDAGGIRYHPHPAVPRRTHRTWRRCRAAAGRSGKDAAFSSMIAATVCMCLTGHTRRRATWRVIGCTRRGRPTWPASRAQYAPPLSGLRCLIPIPLHLWSTMCLHSALCSQLPTKLPTHACNTSDRLCIHH